MSSNTSVGRPRQKTLVDGKLVLEREQLKESDWTLLRRIAELKILGATREDVVLKVKAEDLWDSTYVLTVLVLDRYVRNRLPWYKEKLRECYAEQVNKLDHAALLTNEDLIKCKVSFEFETLTCHLDEVKDCLTIARLRIQYEKLRQGAMMIQRNAAQSILTAMAKAKKHSGYMDEDGLADPEKITPESTKSLEEKKTLAMDLLRKAGIHILDDDKVITVEASDTPTTD